MVCSQCGAGLTGNATECSYCGTGFDRGDGAGGRFSRQPDCPRCHQALIPKSLSNVRVSACRKCDGLWISHDAMDGVLSLKKKHSKRLASMNKADKSASKFRRRGNPGSVRGDVTPAKCPACHHAMRLQPADRGSGIYLDICDDHGTWFDRAELRAIESRYARETLRRSAGGRYEGARSSSDTSDLAVGAGFYLMGAVVDLIGDFDFFD